MSVTKPAARLVNPYLDEFMAAQGGRRGLFGIAHAREDLVHRYSWAVPNEEAIMAIAAHGPILEIGAGSGYWASLLAQVGVDILAYDVAPPDRAVNRFHILSATWHPIREGGPEVAALHPDRALFLCWPPYATSMALDCFQAYQGKTLIYVGEDRGYTANEDFHDVIGGWEETRHVNIPQWSGVHDYLRIFKRLP